MNNRERYKKAFSSLHTSEDFKVRLEDEKMAKGSGIMRKTLIAACTAFALILGTAGAYAADLGGIQRTVQVWINGDQTEAVLNIDESKGEYTIISGDGTIIGGGGVVHELDGSTRPMTAGEIADYIANEVSDQEINGKRYLFYKNQKVEITDLFKDKDYCFVKITDGDNTVYVTAIKDGGISYSRKKFTQPDEFRTK